MNSVTRAWAILLISCLASGPIFAEATNLIPFSMQDQHEKVHTHEELLGAPFVLMVGDKDGMAYVKAWGTAIKLALPRLRD